MVSNIKMNTHNFPIVLMLIQLTSFGPIYANFNNSNENKFEQKRLQGVGVRGRLLCGKKPMNSTKVKIVDVDIRPDLDDLLGETLTDENGMFQIAGATKEHGYIDVILKVYHECMDEHRACQRKVVWRVPSLYYNNGTLTEWFDVGSVNMEIVFPHEERDCRH